MIELTRDDITSASGGSKDSGKSFVRTLFLRHDPDDTMVDCINSAYIPAWNDCHPVYTAFFVTDIGEVQTLSDDEWYIEVTYSNKLDSGSSPVPNETKPWNLPPLDFKIHTFDKQIAMTKYWDQKEKKWKQLLNSAGTPISAKKTVTVGVMSFTMNEKKGNSIPSLNASYIFNSSAETVCGIKIPAFCGKLLPFSAFLHTVNDSSTGKVKYEYYAIDITIHFILPTGDEGNESWEFSMLDIGTLCRDSQGNLGAVYKFFDAKSKEDLKPENVVYGPMESLILFRDAWTGEDKDYPWEEITEPVPLNKGEVDYEAMRGEKPYNTIDGFESRPGSWNRFNLPRKR